MAPLQPMASALDTLQLVLDDVFVQTGKALVATSRSPSANPAQAPGSVQFRMSDTIGTFHDALTDLENEIIRAKSVIQRDILGLRAKREHSQKPQPVDAQTKSPTIIDLDSSPPPVKSQGPAETAPMDAPVAPFPDMGMVLEPSHSPPPPLAMGKDSFKTESTPVAPVPTMDQPSFSQQPSTSAPSNSTAEASTSEPNFTSMQFTLVPTNDEQQTDSGNQSSFNLETFARTESANNNLSLDNILPEKTTNQTNGNLVVAQDLTEGAQGQDDNNDNVLPNDDMNNMSFDEFDDGGNGDDFDFTMDDGNSFDDLMTSHEGNFDTTMQHGQFDDDFFGLNKPDNA